MDAKIQLDYSASSTSHPDLAPSDFHLFGPLKQHLGGQRFDEDDALIADVQNWLHSLDATFFEAGINSLKKRWKKMY